MTESQTRAAWNQLVELLRDAGERTTGPEWGVTSVDDTAEAFRNLSHIVQSAFEGRRIGIFSGAQEPKCYDGWYMDWYDSLLDATGLSKRAAPVFCVANSGPRAVLPRPGE